MKVGKNDGLKRSMVGSLWNGLSYWIVGTPRFVHKTFEALPLSGFGTTCASLGWLFTTRLPQNLHTSYLELGPGWRENHAIGSDFPSQTSVLLLCRILEDVFPSF
jgi:hypothetical protein